METLLCDGPAASVEASTMSASTASRMLGDGIRLMLTLGTGAPWKRIALCIACVSVEHRIEEA